MRTRSSSPLAPRSLRSVAPSDSALDARPQSRISLLNARRLGLALAASAPLCAGALWAAPAGAAPTAESDENGPLVQILQPGYNDVLKGKARILIQVTARKYNPQSVEMFIDDKSASNGPMAISSFASSSYDFPTTGYPDGRHKLTIRVTDSQGFRGWAETTIFINNKGVVDTQAPDLRWVGVEPFQEVSGSMKIEVSAADNFGVKMLKISVHPAESPNDKGTYSWFINQPPYRVNLDTIGKNIPDGLYVLKALAFDSLDQQGEAPPLTFGVLNNQINATRVEDMLEGRRQMQNVLQGKKPTDAPDTKAATNSSAEARTNAAKANEKANDALAGGTSKAPAVVDAAPARPAAPDAQSRPVPAAPTASGQAAPALLPPTPDSTAPTNPGIQLPTVKLPTAPDATATPDATVRPTATATPDADEANITQPDFAAIAPQTPGDLAPEAMAPTTLAPADAIAQTTQTEAAPVAAAPTANDKTYVAAAPRRPIGERNAGQASLSRAGAIDLAVAPSATIVAAPRSAPIEIARLSQPRLGGRAISDAPVWSQSATSAESRLSNAELSRVRAGQTRVLGASRPLTTTTVAPSARALQTSAPTLAERPVLGRAITSNSLSAPASKLTREAKKIAPTKARTAPAGTISKAVGSGKRLAPLDVDALAAKAAKLAPTQELVEIAPARLAKNNATPTPQMSALAAPRMSESASGLGVPSKKAGAAQTAPGKVVTGSLNGERVVALPRPDAAKRNRSVGGASIIAVPLDSALQINNAAPVPTSYRAEANMTLREVAARFGLPVELIAISNNWTSEMRVLRGMEVKLPRPLEVSYNGAPVKGDAPSMLMGDTAVTAFRFMFEKSGGKMEWDAKNQRVVARKDGREITLNIGSNVAKVGEREVAMEIAAFLFQGRTMVPLRFFEEGMNAQVDWNPQTGRLVVAMAG